MINHFPYKTPRDVQAQAAEALDKNWSKYDVFVLLMPTGSGKTAMAKTIAEYTKANNLKTVVGVPNNILRSQYIKEFPEFRTVKAIDEYTVPDMGVGFQHIGQVLKAKRAKGKTKATNARRRAAYACISQYGNPYQEDLLAVKTMEYLTVANFYSIMAHKLYNCADVMVFDEGHNVLPTLQDLHVKKLPQAEYGFPHTINNQEDLIEFTDANRTVDDKKIQKLVEVMEDHSNNWSMNVEYGDHLSKEIHLKPISVKGEAPLIWGGKKRKKQKLIFMSATISEEEIKRLPIDKEVCFIDLSSPIPVERRPIIPANRASMSRDMIEESLPELVRYIKQLADHHSNEKGFIHAPYGLADILKDYIDDDRFVFHTKQSKNDELNRFMNSNEPLILVGSGMYEGIDLKYDMSRWQLITKIPYPSLADSRNRLILKNDPDYYSWLAARDLLQACGRVSRSEDDYGVTYVFDNRFESWYNSVEPLLGSWFKEAVVR